MNGTGEFSNITAPEKLVLPEDLWPIVYRLASGKAWPPMTKSEVANFFDFSNRQYLLELLMADERLPAAVADGKSQFRALSALFRKRFEIGREAVWELQRIVGSESFLLYKGADYRHRIYPRPEQRLMSDMDALVPEPYFKGVVRRLKEAGYAQDYRDLNYVYAPRFHEARFMIGSSLVEIHFSFGQKIRSGIDYRGMWNRREWFDRDGISGYRLSPEDVVLCQAYNLAKDEFTPELNRYIDFYLLLNKYQDRLPQCVLHAKAWGIERALFGALHITSSLFKEAHTHAVCAALQQLLTPKTRQFLVEKVLPDPSTEMNGNAKGRITQLRRKFLLIDKPWRRLAFLLDHLYAIITGYGVRRFNIFKANLMRQKS